MKLQRTVVSRSIRRTALALGMLALLAASAVASALPPIGRACPSARISDAWERTLDLGTLTGKPLLVVYEDIGLSHTKPGAQGRAREAREGRRVPVAHYPRRGGGPHGVRLLAGTRLREGRNPGGVEQAGDVDLLRLGWLVSHDSRPRARDEQRRPLRKGWSRAGRLRGGDVPRAASEARRAIAGAALKGLPPPPQPPPNASLIG